MEKLVVSYPIIVEGKYDKIKLSSVLTADIFTTEGFGIFRKKDKIALFRELSKRSKLIIFTDSDAGGKIIRNYFNSSFDSDLLIHLYIPQIKGKEKRKERPSKAGTLGVEGMDNELLYKLFLPFSGEISDRKRGGITKNDLYESGLSGHSGSSKKRERLAEEIGFPKDISSNALLSAMNILYDRKAFFDIAARISES